MSIKNQKFFADFKMGHLTFVACSYQKLEPKKTVFWVKYYKALKNRVFPLSSDRGKL
jgi:hypothetical protein